jgi:predicted nucleic acid-binding protein
LIVVDTNVLVYLLLPCPKTELAELLLKHQPQWGAPPLWRSEFRNVLTGYLRRGLLQQSRAVALMLEAEETLSAHEEMVATERVLHLVSISSCSSYDCEFVAAAQQLEVPLITEDRAILQAFPTIAQSLHQATS